VDGTLKLEIPFNFYEVSGSDEDLYEGANVLPLDTEREVSSSVTLIPAAGAGDFKIWKEKGGSRILNATGKIANGWQKKLNRAGTGFTSEDFTDGSNINQRVCPGKTPGSGVFINFDNIVDSMRCLYYDPGNATEALDTEFQNPSFVEGEDWLKKWDRALTGRGSAASYYEGNIKVCADKGMRLPTLYETNATSNPFGGNQGQPTGDFTNAGGGPLMSHPAFAGTHGVPQALGFLWTASAYTSNNSDYFIWSGNGITTSAFSAVSADSGAQISPRCVLPN